MGRQQVSRGFPEEAESAAGPGLVHEVDVLVAANAEQTKTCKALMYESNLTSISTKYVTRSIRGHYQIDVKCIKRHVTAGLCFEYLGSYESSEHALSNEVW